MLTDEERAAVAVRVMGWDEHAEIDTGWIEAYFRERDTGRLVRRDDWRPDTDANDRDAVVAAMRAKGWMCRMTVYVHSAHRVAEFVNSNDKRARREDPDSLGTAVCRAALAAVRGGTGDEAEHGAPFTIRDEHGVLDDED